MRKVVPLVFISATAFVIASCSLFVSLDDLQDGGSDASTVSTCDSGSCDGSVVGNDASPDSSKSEAGSGDAGINPCLALDGGGRAGPRMVQGDGYCIDSTEVTVAQYMQFVSDAGPATSYPQIPVCAWNVTFAPNTVGSMDPRCTAANSDPSFRSDYPVTCVNWCDAFQYCDWAGKRLCGSIGGGPDPYATFSPGSQWYLACATTANDAYPNQSNDGGSCNVSTPGSVPVGSLGCNGGLPGLSDMVGNVEEWVDSCDNSGEAPDGGGTSFDLCHDEGNEFGNTFQGGCASNDDDTRNETWAGIGFRCCSK